MKFKDYEPIKFEIFQTDMEKIMYQLEKSIAQLDPIIYPDTIEQLQRIRDDFQHKIDCHIERGDWIVQKD